MSNSQWLQLAQKHSITNPPSINCFIIQQYNALRHGGYGKKEAKNVITNRLKQMKQGTTKDIYFY